MEEIREEIVKYKAIDGTMFVKKEECMDYETGALATRALATRIGLRLVEQNSLVLSLMRDDTEIYVAHFDAVDDAIAFERHAGKILNMNYFDDAAFHDMSGKYTNNSADYAIGDVVIIVEDCYVDVFPADYFMAASLRLSGNLISALNELRGAK